MIPTRNPSDLPSNLPTRTSSDISSNYPSDSPSELPTYSTMIDIEEDGQIASQSDANETSTSLLNNQLFWPMIVSIVAIMCMCCCFMCFFATVFYFKRKEMNEKNHAQTLRINKLEKEMSTLSKSGHIYSSTSNDMMNMHHNDRVLSNQVSVIPRLPSQPRVRSIHRTDDNGEIIIQNVNGILSVGNELEGANDDDIIHGDADDMRKDLDAHKVAVEMAQKLKA